MTLPDEATTTDPTPPPADGNDSIVRYTQADRQELVDDVLKRDFGGVFRKKARILAIQENEDFEVETDRGVVRGHAGDWIATNHPDDDDGADLWPLSDERMAATYHPWNKPIITAVIETPPSILIRHAINALRDQGDGERGVDDRANHAITNLENALLWLDGASVLGS